MASTVSVEILQKTLVNEYSITCHFRKFHLTHFFFSMFHNSMNFFFRSILLLLLSNWRWFLKHLFTSRPQVLNKFVSVYDVKPRTRFLWSPKKIFVMHFPPTYIWIECCENLVIHENDGLECMLMHMYLMLGNLHLFMYKCNAIKFLLRIGFLRWCTHQWLIWFSML